MTAGSAAAPAVPDAFTFDVATARAGLPLNRMLMSLRDPAARQRFRADEAVYCDGYGLDAHQRAAVLDRDWVGMLALGSNIFYLFKLALLDGRSLQYLGGVFTGQSEEAFTAEMVAGVGTAGTASPVAEVIWGLGTSHVPSIGAAMDHGRTGEPYWAPLFDAYGPARRWMAAHPPDVAVIVYNDHANAIDITTVPTFALGSAARYPVADEGFGRRPVPDVVGDPALSDHLIERLVDDGFDLTVMLELEVDHGLTVPLSVYCPEPGEAWPCPVVPLAVNVVTHPQPTAARCYALGQALGRALATDGTTKRVAVFGTGGMSHQLAGARAGYINIAFDRSFLDRIETDPEQLAALSRADYAELAGTEGAELIMWLVMRGALRPGARRVHSAYHVPASNTAAGMVLLDNQPATEAVGAPA